MSGTLRVSLFVIFGATCLTVAPACSPSSGDVAGAVKLNGQRPDLKGLEIAFVAANGRLITAPIDTDGKYKATGVPPGNVLICFVFTPPGDPAAASDKKRRLIKPGETGSPSQKDNPIPLPLRDTGT